jgi:TetR/AcrR family transcriptional regulator
MSRRKLKSDQSATARRILAAAEHHFAAQGMAGARTDEIASAARANKAMLYYYFGDKRRLHRAVLENIFRQLRAGVYAPSARSAESPRKRLLEFITSYFDFLASHPNYPRLVHREAMEATKDFEWIVQDHLRPSHNRLVRTLEEGIRSGEFRNVDTHQTAFTIMGMTTSYFAAAPILSHVVGHDLMAPKALIARKRSLLDFLNHGLLRSKVRSR